VAGSAQIRVDDGNEVWVVTGDFKRDPDPSCEPFEVVPCDVLITEATFGLPVYRWPSGRVVAEDLLDWWASAPDRASLCFAYAFGKTQRLLAELARLPEAQALAEQRGIYLHGAATALTTAYREAGYDLLPTRSIADAPSADFAGALVLAPPSAHRSPWMRRFTAPQTAFASGWMQIRGARRRRGYERGFVLSDHADWNGLVRTADDSGAKRVLVTHGQESALARYLDGRNGVQARPLSAGSHREEDGERG
jgi:putative mRNA 3-end processing factor